MPALRNVRRSRRLSQRPPLDTEFEQFDDHDLHDLQLLYPDHQPSGSSSPPGNRDASPVHQCPSPPSSDDDLPLFTPRSSHSRRKQPGHIPRPPNAFMLFRSDLWAKEKIKSSVERDHRQISRIAGHYWNRLSEAERAPYKRAAEEAKRQHAELFPDYKYSPVYRREKTCKRKVKVNPESNADRWKTVARLLVRGFEGNELEEQLRRCDRKAERDEKEKNVAAHQQPLTPAPSPAALPRRRASTRTRHRSHSSSKQKASVAPSQGQLHVEEVAMDDSSDDEQIKAEPCTPEPPLPQVHQDVDIQYVPTADIPEERLPSPLLSSPESIKVDPLEMAEIKCCPSPRNPLYNAVPQFTTTTLQTADDIIAQNLFNPNSSSPFAFLERSPPMVPSGFEFEDFSNIEFRLSPTFSARSDIFFESEATGLDSKIMGDYHEVDDPLSQFLTYL